MTRDLGYWFRRAADDSDRPPPLPPSDLLALARQARRRHQIRTAGVTGALAVGAIAAVIVAVAVGQSDRDAGPARQPDGRGAAGATVPLDLGPLSDRLAQSIQADCSFVVGVERGDRELARRYDRMDGPVGVVVVRTERGQLVSCSSRVNPEGERIDGGLDGGYLGTYTDKLLAPDARHPVLSFLPLYRTYTRLSGPFEASGAFRVADTVDRVEVRVGTLDGSAPWRVAPAHNGLVYWIAWAKLGAYNADDEVWMTWRAYDIDGHLIDPDLMPFQPQQISGPPP